MSETKIIEISQKLSSLIKVIIVVIGVFLLGELVYQFQSLPRNAVYEINVSGEGKTYAKTDIAMVSLGTHTQANKSQEAVDENNRIMGAVIKSIKDSGVDEKDIQTTMYNLMPMYDYTESGRIFKGYSLDQQVSIKIRNFDKINEILDKATSGGVNTVSDLQFTIDDIEKVKAEARAKAIAQAKEKAVTLTSQAGLRIIKLVNISEGFNPNPMPLYDRGFGGAMVKESIAPQIQTGQMEINTTVTLTYRVK